jgi:hypothetical protein
LNKAPFFGALFFSLSQMKNFNAVLKLLFAFTVLPLFSFAQPASKKSEIDKKVETLLKKMTLEEKVGQMNQYNGFWDATGPQPSGGDAAAKVALLRAGGLGSVLNVQGPERVRALQSVAVTQTRLGIPLLFGSDVVHGYHPQFPIPLGEAASWDLDLMRRTARSAAQEATARAMIAAYNSELAANGHRAPVTTELGPRGDVFLAEDYHQQYLAKNPNGYCGIGGTGVSCPLPQVKAG